MGAIRRPSRRIGAPRIRLRTSLDILQHRHIRGLPVATARKPRHDAQPDGRTARGGRWLPGVARRARSTTAPTTIEPASAALSPPAATPPAGEVLPLGGNPQAAVVDAASGSLVVLHARAQRRRGQPDRVRPIGEAPQRSATRSGDRRRHRRRGSAYAATRGGFFTVDLAAGTSTRTTIEGRQDTDFTAIARRADGRVVLGSADGKALTLSREQHRGEARPTSSRGWMRLSPRAIRRSCWTVPRPR